MLTVGENLVMFGGFSYNNSEFQDMKSTVVYNTVSGRLTRIPLNPKWDTLPACAVSVSDTEFVTLEDVPDNDSQCSKKMIKHNIFNNDTVELPCMTNIMDGIDGPIRCAAEAGFLYALGGRSAVLWQFNLQTQARKIFKVLVMELGTNPKLRIGILIYIFV